MTEITLIICFTVYLLCRGFITEYVRKMELENDRRELENDAIRYSPQEEHE